MAGTNASSESAARVQNPEPGTVLVAPAGGQVEALFDFENDAPDPAAFHLQVEGLPGPEWASGVGLEGKVTAAAQGWGTLRLTLSPPAEADIRDYPFRARIFSGDYELDKSARSLILRVKPGAHPPEQPERATGREEIRQSEEPPARTVEDPPAETRKPQEPPAQAPGGNGATAGARPRETAHGIPVRPVPAAREETRDLHPVHDDDDLEVVDLQEAVEETKAPIDEPSVLDPRDGSVLSLRPGETLLLRFSFTNTASTRRTYVIEEDRSLDPAWINIIQDQIHLDPNAPDELTARLTPPPSAEPGNYPFLIRIGPMGSVLTPCNLTLNVAATPAVRLKADAERVSAGPFARAVDFQLSVERAGNADTAFRIAVKAPRAKAEDAPEGGDTQEPGEVEVYETPAWRYLFDREMASLESPTYGRAPKPEPIRLRIQRKGTWWLGFRESHPVRVAAVPVTDPGNGGKTGNTAELTAVRWRLLPFPFFLAAPLALLALTLLGGAASDLRVIQPTYEAPDSVNYVVAVPEKNAVRTRLTWKAPWYALLRLSGGGERTGFVRPPHEVQAVFSETGARSVQREYRVTSLLGSSQSARVRFVRARSDTPLEVSGAQRTEDGGYLLAVRRGVTTTLTLRNRATQFNRINYWVAKRPGAAFRVIDLLNEGSLDPIAHGGAPFVIKVRPGEGEGGGIDELVFVTTDSTRPVVTIKLVSPKEQ